MYISLVDKGDQRRVRTSHDKQSIDHGRGLGGYNVGCWKNFSLGLRIWRITGTSNRACWCCQVYEYPRVFSTRKSRIAPACLFRAQVSLSSITKALRIDGEPLRSSWSRSILSFNQMDMRVNEAFVCMWSSDVEHCRCIIADTRCTTGRYSDLSNLFGCARTPGNYRVSVLTGLIMVVKTKSAYKFYRTPKRWHGSSLLHSAIQIRHHTSSSSEQTLILCTINGRQVHVAVFVTVVRWGRNSCGKQRVPESEQKIHHGASVEHES